MATNLKEIRESDVKQWYLRCGRLKMAREQRGRAVALVFYLKLRRGKIELEMHYFVGKPMTDERSFVMWMVNE